MLTIDKYIYMRIHKYSQILYHLGEGQHMPFTPGGIKTFWSHIFGLLCITAKGSGETTGSCVCPLAAYVVGDSQGELTHSDDFNYQWPCTMSNNWEFTRVPRFEPFLVWFGKHFGGSKATDFDARMCCLWHFVSSMAIEGQYWIATQSIM
jgi:hypothetical protein